MAGIGRDNIGDRMKDRGRVLRQRDTQGLVQVSIRAFEETVRVTYRFSACTAVDL
jgi:hypothetical protein